MVQIKYHSDKTTVSMSILPACCIKIVDCFVRLLDVNVHDIPNKPRCIFKWDPPVLLRQPLIFSFGSQKTFLNSVTQS